MADILSDVQAKLVGPLIGVIVWLLLAIIIMTIFWLISRLVKRIVIQICQSFGIDSWVEEHKITPAIGNKKVSEVLGSLAKWYFIWFGLFVVVDSLPFLASIFGVPITPLPGLRDFLGTVVNYVPQALAGVLFFVLALLFARYLANQILVLQHRLKNLVAFALEGLIILFAAVVSLQMILGSAIAQTILQLLQIFVQPFIVAFAIVSGVVAGLAIGLGFKEEIQKFSKEVRKEYFG